MTNKSVMVLPVVLMASTLLPGCAIVEGIFKAGFWTATFIGIFILLIIIFIIAKISSKNKNG